MRHHNILSKKVTLAATVMAGQVVNWSGNPATTGTAGKEPAGIALYEGKAGDTIAIMCIGLVDVKATGLAVGDGVKAAAGKVVKAATAAESFATVSEVNSRYSVELVLGSTTGIDKKSLAVA